MQTDAKQLPIFPLFSAAFSAVKKTSGIPKQREQLLYSMAPICCTTKSKMLHNGFIRLYQQSSVIFYVDKVIL
ncbi:MAG: hypothetical protein ACXV8P_03550 [Methylobacter sp.]